MNPSKFDAGLYRTQKNEKEKYKKFIQHSLKEDYYMLCIKKCVKDFNSNLSGSEKVCLAKCVDRAYDFFVLEEKNLNPYIEKTESKDIFLLQRMLS